MTEKKKHRYAIYKLTQKLCCKSISHIHAYQSQTITKGNFSRDLIEGSLKTFHRRVPSVSRNGDSNPNT